MTTHVGIIGAGNISGTHARAARAIGDVELVAVYGTNAAKLRAFCVEHGGAAYSDFGTFLKHRPMDIVLIGSPSGLHAEQGIAAARAGLHVLTEKPLDISLAKAEALVAASEAAGVKLGVFFQDRRKSSFLALKRAIDAGSLGNSVLADARVKWWRPEDYYSGSSWRGTLAMDGGGALINQAIHTLDLLLWLFGDVTRVQAAKRTAVHRIEAEDTVVATLEFASGALGALQAATSVYPGFPRRIELTGSKGTVAVEHDCVVSVHWRDPETHAEFGGEADGNASATSAAVQDVRGHQAILEDFLYSIETNEEPACDGREGLRSLALAEAIYESCRTGAAVKPVIIPKRA